MTLQEQLIDAAREAGAVGARAVADVFLRETRKAARKPTDAEQVLTLGQFVKQCPGFRGKGAEPTVKIRKLMQRHEKSMERFDVVQRLDGSVYIHLTNFNAWWNWRRRQR